MEGSRRRAAMELLKTAGYFAAWSPRRTLRPRFFVPLPLAELKEKGEKRNFWSWIPRYLCVLSVSVTRWKVCWPRGISGISVSATGGSCCSRCRDLMPQFDFMIFNGHVQDLFEKRRLIVFEDARRRRIGAKSNCHVDWISIANKHQYFFYKNA